MRPQEIFDLFDPTCEWQIERGLDIASQYWALEYEIADEIGAPYTDLEGATIEDRTCAVCGTVNDTTEWGRVPHQCAIAECEKLRSFWRTGGDISRFYAVNGTQEKRAWFKRRIERTFKAGQKLSDIPNELRFEFLLMTMIERVAYENSKND